MLTSKVTNRMGEYQKQIFDIKSGNGITMLTVKESFAALHKERRQQVGKNDLAMDKKISMSV